MEQSNETNEPYLSANTRGTPDANRAALERVLPTYLKGRRWFGGKARKISKVTVEEEIPFGEDVTEEYIALLRVDYADGGHQIYMLPVGRATGAGADDIRANIPQAIVTDQGKGGLLYDASFERAFATSLLQAIEEGRRFPSDTGEIVGWATDAFGTHAAGTSRALKPSVLGAEQSNTSVKYGDRFILKLYRRLEEGTNPDLEIGFFLTERGFEHIPSVAGALEYRKPGAEPITLGILMSYVANQGDAWQYTLSELDSYLERVAQSAIEPSALLMRGEDLPELEPAQVPDDVRAVIGHYINDARLLGRRTAELHLALASDPANPDFRPEPFTLEYQQELHADIRRLTASALDLLAARLDELPQQVKGQASALLANREEIEARFQPLLDRQITATRTRVHGDYHLGQVLYTGDFCIIDFEGEPIRTLPERRRKQSPLKDVAGMLRSFHYAAYSAFFAHRDRDSNISTRALEHWADVWHMWVHRAFLGEYLAVAGEAFFLPRSSQDLEILLDSLVLEKAIYELIYELNNRPDWVGIPLQGIIDLI